MPKRRHRAPISALLAALLLVGAGWTFGRLGDGYVALYSWRPTVWQEYTPEELEPLPPSHRGPIVSPFDLQAPGGPDNVWITECGSARTWGSFPAFVSAVRAAPVSVIATPTSVVNATGPVHRFAVRYESPSQGSLEFGWEEALRVQGETIPIDGYPRMENPWVSSERGASQIRIEGQLGGLFLDWELGTREAFGRRASR